MSKHFGVDISEHQRGLSIRQAKAEGVEFAVLRAGITSGGTPRADLCFESFYNDCGVEGLPVGTYYYSRATTVEEAEREANFYARMLSGKEWQMPHWMDVEDSAQKQIGKAKLTAVVRAFISKMRTHGHECGIYSSSSFLRDYLNDGELTDVPHWVAQWTVNKPSDCLMWQFGGEVNKLRDTAIAGKVIDQNFYYGELKEMCKQKDKKSYPYTNAPELKLGSRGDWVKTLQKELNKNGASLEVDGDFGNGTYSAVVRFQREHGLTADGIAGAATWAQLNLESLAELSPIDDIEGTPAERMIHLAETQIGYREHKSNTQIYDFTANAGSGNWTKFGYEIDKFFPGYFNGNKNGFEWCAQFYTWLMLRLFGKEAAEKLSCANKGGNYCAGCMEAARYYRSQYRFFDSPEPGDQIFFGSKYAENHTGLVKSVNLDDGWVTTIEGNRDDCVAEYGYSLRDTSIAGYGRPDWRLVANAQPEIPAETEQPKPTNVEKAVKLLKEALELLGGINEAKTEL